MKTIVFIGTNKSGSSMEAIQAAVKLGYFTVVFTNIEKQIIQREEYKDVHEMIHTDVENLAAMRKEIKKLQLQGKEVMTVISFIDSYVHKAAILCNEFCENCDSEDAIYKMENKVETRLSLQNQSFTPAFFIINPDEPHSLDSMHSITYPVMVKSPQSTGSKDVLFTENFAQLEKNIEWLKKHYPGDPIVIEEYVDGNQYLVEAVVYENKVHIAAIIRQEITKGKRFIVTGYEVLTDVPVYLEKSIESILQSIILQFGITNGALHLELRRSKNGWKLIEINPRISGCGMNKMLKAAFGFNLAEEILKLYLGEKPSIKRKSHHYVFTQYIVLSKKGTLEKVTGKKRALESPGVVDVYIKPRKGAKLSPPISMGQRYAYVIATGANPGEASRNAKNAAKKIEFHLIEE